MNKKRGYYTAKIGGKQRTLRFNMNFWAEFTDNLGISLEDLGSIFQKGISISSIRALVYCGLITFDREQGNEIDYNIYTVGSWLDDFDAQKIEDVVNAMMQSKILGNELNMGIQRNEDPKNQTQKKSQPN